MPRVAAIFSALLLMFMCSQASAAEQNFHDQPEFTQQELQQFLKDFPAFREWAVNSKDTSSPVVTDADEPSFVWSPQAEAYLRENTGWAPERFFYVMTHVFAGRTVLRHGSQVTGDNRPPDMPVVSDAELDLIRTLMPN